MGYGNKTVSGSLLFVAAVVYLIGTVVGEKFGNMELYSAAIVALGVLMLVGVYFIHMAFKSMLFSALLGLAGIGTLGVGVLTYFSYATTEYYVFAAVGYVAFALASIASYKFEKNPLSYLSIFLGAAQLIALALWAGNIDLGGGMKVTPLIIDLLLLLWLTGFGAHIIGEST
jgi:hypothetical protein